MSLTTRFLNDAKALYCVQALGRDKLQELVLPAYRAAGRKQAGTCEYALQESNGDPMLMSCIDLLAHWILQADENGKAFRHGLLPDAETLQKMAEEVCLINLYYRYNY
jgi:hypothetical protein